MNIIYKIVNTSNEKIYIGKTSKTLEHRWSAHQRSAKHGSQQYFYKAIRKHGPEKFIIEQIDYTEDELECDNLEKAYIGMYQSYKPEWGYNGTLGGEGGVPNEEIKEKIRLKSTGRKHSAETKLKLSLGRIGKYVGVNHPRYGETHSEETKQKMKDVWGSTHGKGVNHSQYRRDISNELLVEAYYDTHNTMEVSRRLNIPQSTVYRRLKSVGAV